jgi:hypothetical protein
MEPKQNGRMLLTEKQFNLVRKVYMRSFQQGDGKFALNDDQMVM